MRFTVFTAAATVLLATGTAMAQSVTSSAAASSASGGFSICAQSIVDACVDGYQSRIKGCQGNDWICLCDVYTDVNQCYDNCPNSDQRPPIQNQVKQYCDAAAPLKSSSASVAATMSRASTSASAASQTGSQTSGDASATPFKTNAAAPVAMPMGGAFAMLLGVAGML